jgi:hypothetical protein
MKQKGDFGESLCVKIKALTKRRKDNKVDEKCFSHNYLEPIYDARID